MQKLVIQSNTPKKIDRVYQSMTDPYAKLHPGQMFRVVAESTSEEWIECLVSFGEERSWAEFLAGLDPYFYVIQTD